MKHLIMAAILASLTLSSFAQKTPTLNAATPIKKSSVVENMYPRITLNSNKCRFDHLTIESSTESQYDLKIFFSRPCDDQENFVLTFSDLQDAKLVKDLILKEEDYEFFHLFNQDEKSTTFEVVYFSKGN